MASFHTHLFPSQRKTTPEHEDSSKKRKWEEPQAKEPFEERLRPENTKSIFDIELHLETSLPLEWQRYLDIQSGQVHFYNTRTHKRTSRDPRRSPEPPNPGHMTLDLDLNLGNKASYHSTKHNSSCSSLNSSDPFMNFSLHKKNSADKERTPSRLALEAGDQQETVATVCENCFMLVMLCKPSPVCPNCKFMHPPDQSPSNLFHRWL